LTVGNRTVTQRPVSAMCSDSTGRCNERRGVARTPDRDVMRVAGLRYSARYLSMTTSVSAFLHLFGCRVPGSVHALFGERTWQFTIADVKNGRVLRPRVRTATPGAARTAYPTTSKCWTSGGRGSSSHGPTTEPTTSPQPRSCQVGVQAPSGAAGEDAKALGEVAGHASRASRSSTSCWAAAERSWRGPSRSGTQQGWWRGLAGQIPVAGPDHPMPLGLPARRAATSSTLHPRLACSPFIMPRTG